MAFEQPFRPARAANNGCRPFITHSERAFVATFGEALERARQLLGAGDLVQAEPIYRRLVETVPQAAEPWHELGILHLQAGRTEAAAECLRQAVTLDPGRPAYHINLATAYRMLKRPDDAIASFEHALKLGPPTAELLNNLALSWKDTGQTDSALRAFDKALRLRPDYANGHFNRANLLLELGRRAEAAESYQRAIDAQPTDAVAHCKLGMVYCELAQAGEQHFDDAPDSPVAASAKHEKLKEAVACFRRALELARDYAEAYSNLAIVLTYENDLVGAAAYWRRALELQPDHAEAHGSLAVVMEKQGRLDEAVACWRRALEVKPDYADAHNNLGAVLSKQERIDEAAACWRRALELKPDFTEASKNLAIQRTHQGRIAEAKECYRNMLRFHPDQEVWQLCGLSLCPVIFNSSEEIERYRRTLLEGLEDLSEKEPTFEVSALAEAACTPSFNLQFHGHNDRPIREAYARLFSNCIPTEVPTGSPGRRRIGFVVTDRHEAVFLKHLGGILEHMNPDLFELVAIGSDAGIRIIRSGIRNPALRLVGVANKFDAFAKAIREAELGLLYHWEVGTDSINYFLPYLRLAPVQCTSWGIQVTSGIPQVDYYLSSELVEPEDARSHYTENLVLASTLLTFQRRVSLGDSPKSRQHFGVAEDQHLYLCAQQIGKFHPDFDPILAGILRRDPRGVVVATGDRHGGFIVEELRRRFAATIGDVAERILFVPLQPNPDYLSLIAAADVLLDPLHFAGLNTSYDGFSLNQPIVTLPARFERTRYTLGCYKKMGFSDCVASTPEQYIDIAVALGTDAKFRAEVVEKIRRASPVLFEDMEAVREHERIFSGLLQEARSTRRTPTS